MKTNKIKYFLANLYWLSKELAWAHRNRRTHMLTEFKEAVEEGTNTALALMYLPTYMLSRVAQK